MQLKPRQWLSFRAYAAGGKGSNGLQGVVHTHKAIMPPPRIHTHLPLESCHNQQASGNSVDVLLLCKPRFCNCVIAGAALWVVLSIV